MPEKNHQAQKPQETPAPAATPSSAIIVPLVPAMTLNVNQDLRCK